MKLKKTLALAVLCLITVHVFPQFGKIDVKIGPEYGCPEIESGCDRAGYLYLNSNHEILDLFIDRTGWYSMAFDPSTLQRTNAVNSLKKYEESGFSVVQMADKLYWLMREGTAANSELNAYRIDMKTGKMSTSHENLISSQEPFGHDELTGITTSKQGAMNRAIGVDYSTDMEHLLIHYLPKEPMVEGKQKFVRMGYVVVDKGMRKLSSGDVVMPYPEREITRISSIGLDSKMNIYRLLKIKGKAADRFEIECLTPGSKIFKKVPLDLSGGSDVATVCFGEDKDGTVYASLFASGGWRADTAAYLYKLNATEGTAIQVGKAHLPFYTDNTRMLDSLHLKGIPRALKKVAGKLGAQKMIFAPDGSKIVIGCTYEFMPFFNFNYPNFYGEEQLFISCSFAPDGQKQWSHLIDSKLSGLGIANNASSAIHNPDPANFIVSDDGIYVLYRGEFDVKLRKISWDGKQVDKTIMEDSYLLSQVSDGNMIVAKVKNRSGLYQMIALSIK